MKGNDIRSSLEKIQKKFSEEINGILVQIENYEIAQSSSSNSLESKYKERINQITYDKDRIIQQLKEELDLVKKDNATLSNKINEQIEEYRNKVFVYENNIKDMEQKLLKKDEEIFIKKSQIEGLISQYQNQTENEKVRLESNYEKKIHAILNEAEQERNKLLELVKQREDDIENIIKENKQQSSDLLATAQKLKEENSKLTTQLQSALTHQKVLEENADNISMGNQNYSDVKKEKDKMVKDVNSLNTQNQKLLEENLALKEKVKKLEAMIYGKIKPFTDEKNNKLSEIKANKK